MKGTNIRPSSCYLPVRAIEFPELAHWHLAEDTP
jgi:hypothetical protein